MLSRSKLHRRVPSLSEKVSSGQSSQPPRLSVAGYRHAHFELRHEILQQPLHVLTLEPTARNPHQLVDIDCHWKSGYREHRPNFSSQYYTVDLLLEVSTKPPTGQIEQQKNRQEVDHYQDEDYILELSRTSRSIRHFLSVVHSLSCNEGSANAMLKLVLPSASGYVARADFLEMRLKDCPRVGSFHGFLEPLERCESLNINHLQDYSLLDVIKKSAGVILLKAATAVEEIGSALKFLEKDLEARLNIRWVLDQPICSKRIALVRGRPNAGVGDPVYRAASALGVKLVIVDEESHWLRPDTMENRRRREAFLVTDMNEDHGIVSRIVHSIKQYPLYVDGIFTLSDNFLIAVAAAATQLGLPTCPVSAFETSVDKYLSRLLEADDGQTARVNNIAELKTLMTTQKTTERTFAPRYPMIVKPTKGWSSECVAKVSNEEEMFIAVESACGRHGGSAVIESYIDGPEIDVNFILCHGEIVFVEIVDELPSRGDAKDAAIHDNFSETGLMFPSMLPDEEQRNAITTLRDMLVKLGFVTGSFHVEARIENSSMEYRNVGGVTDLAPASYKPTASPRCRLIEINARPAGFRVTLATKNTYGVDFFAAQILAAVGDLDRLKALSQPFQTTVATNGAQYWSRVVYIAVPRSGIVKQEDACADLLQRCPDLVPYISIAHCYFTKGDWVTSVADGATSFFAHFLVFFRQSRQHAMEIAGRVQAEFRIELEVDC